MIATTQNLRLQLEKEPTSPEKIAKLVMGRGCMPMEDINDIVTKTKGVTCLIPMAYPKAGARDGATIEMATNRLGVNRVISIMLLNLLNAIVQQVFKDNVGMVLQKDELQLPASEDGYIVCAITFGGEANGVISLCFTPQTSRDVAIMLTDPTAPQTPNNTHERLGDLGYYIADLFIKQMAESALACTILDTKVDYRLSVPKETVSKGTNDVAYFRSGTSHVNVHLGIHLTKTVEDRRSEFGVT